MNVRSLLITALSLIGVACSAGDQGDGQGEPADPEDAEETLLVGLLTAWETAEQQGEIPASRGRYLATQRDLAAALAAMSQEPGEYSVSLARAESTGGFSVDLVEDTVIVQKDSAEDSCDLGVSANILSKRRWSGCMKRLMSGEDGRGVGLEARTRRVAGRDGVLGNRDDVFVTTCVKRAPAPVDLETARNGT